MFTWLQQMMARRAVARQQAQAAKVRQVLLAQDQERVEQLRAQQEQQAAVQTLAWPRRAAQIVVLPAGLSLPEALRQAQLLRLALPRGPTEPSPRSSTSKPQTARQTSRRRGRK